jgi:Zn-dependent oligopeptidase
MQSLYNRLGMQRELFQETVLTPLKREGIVATLVYPGPQGGVFIPCEDQDIHVAARQLLKRVTQELHNLEQLVVGQTYETTVHALKQAADTLRKAI